MKISDGVLRSTELNDSSNWVPGYRAGLDGSPGTANRLEDWSPSLVETISSMAGIENLQREKIRKKPSSKELAAKM